MQVRQFLYSQAQRLLLQQCAIHDSWLNLPRLSQLRNLVLQNIHTQPTTLKRMLSPPALGKLTSLELDDITNNRWHRYDFACLSDLLNERFLDLEIFTFVNTCLVNINQLGIFKSLQRLSRLRTLQVDLVLMVHLFEPSKLDDTIVSLPLRLEKLWLTDCKSHDIVIIRDCKDGGHTCHQPEVGKRDAWQAIWDSWTESKSAPALESLVVSVVQETPGATDCGCLHTQVNGESMKQL